MSNMTILHAEYVAKLRKSTGSRSTGSRIIKSGTVKHPSYTFHDRNYVVLQNTLRLARCQQDIRQLHDQR